MKPRSVILLTCVLALAPLATTTAQTQVLAWGDNSAGQLNVPALPPGLSYTQVAAGYDTSAAVRSDGSVVVWGDNTHTQANVTPLPPGLTYTQVAVGENTVAALRSDGSIVVWGAWDSLFSTPPLPFGLHYTQVAAGGWTTWDPWTSCPVPYSSFLALRSDGTAVAWGNNGYSVITVPALPPGYIGTQVAAGGAHTLALVSAVPNAPVIAIGAGCPGSNGVTALGTVQPPSMGNSGFALDVTGGAINSQAFLFHAASKASPSISLGGACMLHLDIVSLQALVAAGLSPMGPLPTGATGMASFALPIPADPALAGFSICFQAAVLDPPAPLGFTVSNGVQCTLQ